MAEMFMFNIAEILLRKLGVLLLPQLCLAKGVETELHKLQNSCSTIKAVLLDAEEQQVSNRGLREWLGKLKDAFSDADDLLDEFEIEALRHRSMNHHVHWIIRKVFNFLPTPHSLLFRFSMGRKLKNIRERLDEIAAVKDQFHLTERGLGRRAAQGEREMTHSFVRSIDVIGRNNDKEKIVKMLMSRSSDDEHAVIPIVGIGGLGKTTLAKLVYNDERIAKNFDLKLWVCVSEDFDMKVLMRKIVTSVTHTTYGDLDIDQLQNLLRSRLVANKFLLILDDVWNSDLGKWRELKSLLMDGARGSKIIVTTRSKLVASVMGTIHRSYNLEGLGLKDCLSLFLKWAFPKGEERKHPNLVRIGEDIVNKCKGVPLAARTLGSLLFKKTDETDWLQVKNSEMWRLKNQTPDDILPALRLSYDQLPSHLKQCFAYCSIFPKAQYLYKDKLIQLWMAQGLIQTSDQTQELEDVGSQYFDELCSMSLFQEVEGNGPLYVTFRIHDLVQDLAQSVAQTECIVKKFHTGDISKMVRHVSFLGCDYSSEQEVPRSVLKLEKLRTIFFPRDGIRSVHPHFIDACISNFFYLRMIDLADSCIEVLPDSVGNLKHLRFLDLSRNYCIKELPNSICKLLALQTLRISDCKELKKLPRDTGNLISLRHFYVTTQQECFSKKEIGCLTSLRSLCINGCTNLVSLPEEIRQLTALQTLSINRCPQLASLPSSIANLTALQNLIINDCEKLNLLEVEGIQGLSIRTMVIGELPKLEALPQWLHGIARSINYLRIACCPNLLNLPEWLRNSASLQKLEILECPKLSALPEGFQHLNALKVLRIKECNMLSSRCRPGTGEDWWMIAHIPEIYLNKTKITPTHY